MKNLLLLVAIIGAAWAWQNGHLPSFLSGDTPNAFDANGNPQLLIFTRDNCQGYCAKQLKELKRRQAPYIEHHVDVDNASQESHQLWKKMGRKNFPYIAAGNDGFSGDATWQLSNLLASNFGDKYLTYREKRFYREHFYPGGKPKIVMYGTSWCGYCRKLREELQAANVDYIEIDVEKHSNPKLLSSTMGISGYPTVWVGYKRVKGWQLHQIQKYL